LLFPLEAYKLKIIKIGDSVGDLTEELDYLEYLDLEKDHNDTLMRIERDMHGRFIGATEEQKANHINSSSTGMRKGWYQDFKGSLYHYDGVVWDEVPDGDIKQLEYLG
jgi:hypothetical protein